MAKSRIERINELYKKETSKKDNSREARINRLYEEEKKTERKVTPKPLVEPEERTDSKLGAFFKGTGKQMAGGYGSAAGTILQNEKAMGALERMNTSTGDPMQNLARDISGRIVNRIKGDDYAKAREEEKKAVRNDLDSMGQNMTAWADKKLSEGAKDIEYVKEDMGAVGKFGVDVASQGMMMASDALLSAIAPGLGQASFATRAAGFGANEARKEGASEDQQLLYGAATGLMELGLEKLFSAGKYLKGMYGEGALDIATPLASKVATSNLVKGIAKTPKGQELVYQLTKAGVAMGEEGIEEALADLISPLLQRAVYADEIDMPTFKQVAYDFLLGAATGGVFGAGGTVADYRSGVGRMEQVQEAQASGRDITGEMISRASVQGNGSEAQQFSEHLASQRESGKEVLGGQLNDLQGMTSREQIKHETELRKQKEAQDRERMAGNVDSFTGNSSETARRAIVEISSGLAQERMVDIENIVAENEDLRVALSGDSATFEAVAKVAIGTATTEDIDRILMKPAAKTLVKEYTGVNMPVSNTAARKSLENLVVFTGAENRTDIQTRAKAKIAEDMSSSLGGRGSSLFVNMYQNVSEADVDKFNTIFKRFYSAGEYSMPIETISKLVDGMGSQYQAIADKYFTPEMRSSIHKAGFADSKVETAKNEERVIHHENVADRAKKGAFEDHSTVKASKQMKRALIALAKRSGVNIVYVDTLGESNGIYDNGTIYLAADADNPIITVAKHELTHYLKEYAPKEYQELEDYVFGELYKNDQSRIDRAIEDKIKFYASHDKKLTRSAAKEELLADMAEAFFTEESAIEKAIAYSKELGEAILDGIRSILDTLLAIADADSNKTVKGYGELLDQIGILREAERKWMKALQASLKNDAVNKDGKIMRSVKESAVDSEGRDLSEGQQKYFANSKVRDAEGRLKVMYHGTENAGFTVFDNANSDDGRSFFFADRLDVASGYSATNKMFKPLEFETVEDVQEYILDELGEEVEIVQQEDGRYVLYQDGEFVVRDEDLYSLFWSFNDEIVGYGGSDANYEVYLNIENPLIVDADNSNWDEIPVDWTDDLLTTRAIAEYAQENGYDGVMINNVVDTGLYGDRFEVGNIAVAFEPNQIKSVHNENPTDSPDIRYSLKDSDGNKLSKEQQEYFKDSKVRDDAGNLLVLYHGSVMSEPFTVFDITDISNGVWLATNKNYSAAYSMPRNGEAAENEVYADDERRIYKVYANIENPLDIGEINGYLKDEFIQRISERMGIDPRLLYDPNDSDSLAYDYYYDDNYGDDYNAYIWEFTRSYEFIEFAKAHGYDCFVATEGGERTFCAFDAPNQVKLITNEKPTTNPDVRYSIKDEVTITESGTVAKHSLKSWTETDKEKLLKGLKDAGYAEDDIEKWMDDVNSVAAIIAADRGRLDYTPDQHQKMLKDNDEYYRTLDASTLCKKRLLYQGTYNAIQHLLPNTPLLAEDVIRIRQLMDKAGLEVPCGICYEESRKKHEGKFAQNWLTEYKKNHKGDYVPTLDLVTTTDGRAWLRRNHPDVLEDYLAYQRGRGSANPKVSLTRTEYRGEILKMHPTTKKNIMRIGGLRIQSFSDFEVPHLIDMMQAIMDMSVKGLKSQAYTKVPAFARVFGGTGVKINLSLIGQVDESGKLVFDDKEGMPHEEAFAIREMYPEDVGTILVGANRESILAAWADDRIDMVIPFHRSGWSFDEMEKLGLTGYKDFTESQHEKYLDDERGAISFDDYKKFYGKKMEELYTSDYWNPNKTGKENAEIYLQRCAKEKRRPVFYDFLVDNGDGSYSLQPDGSTDGYWKSLTDFKMYNNDGVGAPQKLVQPNFNMEEARKILAEYEEDSDNLPVADDIVEQFVAEYKAAHPGAKYQLKEGPSVDRKVKSLEDRVAYLKSEMKLTGLKTPVEKDTKVQASRLLKKYGSNLVLQNKLVNTMKDIFKIYKTGGDWGKAYAIAEDMARDIVDKIEILHDEAWQEYADLREHLRKTPIAVSENVKKSFADYEDFRRRNMGRIKLTNNQGMSVDEYYQSLMESWPGKFTDEYTEGTDQLQHIEDVLNSLAPWYEEYSSDEMQDFVIEIAADIMETTEKLATRKTFADRKAEEKTAAVEKVRRERNEAMERMKERYEEKLIRQNKASREKLEDYKEKQKDKASRKKAMDRLLTSYEWLNERLINPSDTKHIPEDYRVAVAELLEGFDFGTVRADAYEAKNGPSKRIIKLRAFKDRFREIMDAQKNKEFIEIDPDFLAYMDEISDAVDGKRLDELDTATLDRVSRLLKQLRHQVSYINRCFNDDIRETIADLGETAIHDANKTKSVKELSGLRMQIDNLLNKLNVTPADMFELIGGAEKKLYQAMRDGFDRHVQNVQAAIKFTQAAVDPKEAKKWSEEKHTFSLEDGKVEMTTTQLMSLYALMQREQAQGHILGSGIVMAPIELKGGKFRTKHRMEETHVMPTLEEVLAMVGTLTEEQKQVADHMRGFLSGECAEWGNRTSMKLYGYKKFTEKDYFPIKSSDSFLNENFDTKGVETSLKSMGFTKALTKKANNPIVIDDFFTVFTDHVNKMSMYEALVPAMSDFQRVYNYKHKNEEGKQADSVQMALKRAYGTKTVDYIKKFMEDLNGAQRSRNDAEIATNLISTYKKASIGGNVRVLLQQPTSIIRAFAVMSPKYFVATPPTKAEVKEMQEHCPIAQWKSHGFYNTDVARDMKEIMLGESSLIDDVFMKSYGKADDIAWACIWKAVKKEVEDQHPDLAKGSDEYWQKVNERASYVFDRTQVVDSVFHRSQIMRNKGTFEKMATSFMAEPTKTYNLLRTEILTAKRELQSGKKADATKRMSRVLSTYLFATMSTAMAAAIADAMRGAGGGDEEENKGNFRQRWWAHSIANFMESANPLSMIPFVKDAVSMYSGYDIERMDLQGIAKLLNVQSMWEGILDGSSKYTPAHAVRKTAEAISYFTGLPVKNVLRDVESITKCVAEAFGNGTAVKFQTAKWTYTLSESSNNRYIFADLYYDALSEGDHALAREIKRYMTSHGVTTKYIDGRKSTWSKNKNK